MGLGLLLLVSTGMENVIVNTNPTITFFKKVYNKSSTITNEILPQYFKSMPNFGKRLSVNIASNADMIQDMTLYFELPEIPPSNHSSLPPGIKQFAWVNSISYAMIKSIDIEIGGILISRHYGDWLYIYSTMNTSLSKVNGNDFPEVTNFSNGKNSYKIYLPLSFFFNNDNKMSLPLLALSKQEVKIHIELNDFSLCYNESPTHYFTIDSFICLYIKGEMIRQNVDGVKSIGEFVYFDINTNRIYYNMKYNTFLVPTTTTNINKYSIVGDTSGYSTIPTLNSIVIQDESYFYNPPPVLKDSYILGNYIYLNSNERWYFLNNELQYIVPIVLNVLEKDVTSINSNYKLQLYNPHQILIWRAQLNSNITINDTFNYTSLPLTTNMEPLIQSNKLIINSIPRTELYNYQHYTYLQNYINQYVSNDGIYMYSFGLNPYDDSPKGTMNFSMIDDAYIQLTMNKLVNYQNVVNVTAYGIYYNILIIKNGNSSMKYYS